MRTHFVCLSISVCLSACLLVYLSLCLMPCIDFLSYTSGGQRCPLIPNRSWNWRYWQLQPTTETNRLSIRSSVHLSNCPSVFTWVSVYVFCCRFPYASCACLYIAVFANLCLAVLLFLVLGWVDLTLFQALLHRPICLCVCFLLLCYMWQSCTPMDERHVTTLRERERHSDSRKGRDIIETETETGMGACLRSGRLTL